MNNFEIVLTKNDKDILVANSVEVAKNLGVNHRDLLEKIDKYVEKFNKINSSIGVAETYAHLEFYIPSTYIHPQNKQQYRNFLITKKGIAQLIGGYSSAVEKAFDLNVAYINRFEEMEQQLKNNVPTITEEQKLVLSIYAGGVEAVEATKALVELKTKELQKTIEYKEDVIVGLTDEIDLKDKRQILNQVVRYKGANYQERWKMLYYEFSKKYHIDLNTRIKRYNEENKPKLKNKLDYIDKVMGKLPQLYEIASKLFEGDINKIIEEYKQIR